MPNNVPVQVPWYFVRGDDLSATFRLEFGGEPVDLTGVTIEGEARDTEDGDHLETIGVDLANQTTNKGVYTLSLRGAYTADFPDEAVGDVEFTISGTKRTLQRFKFLLTKDTKHA